MIWIPELAWDGMLDAFAAAPPSVERVAYLDGVVLDEEAPSGVVTTVVIPDAVLHPGRYTVTADAMSQAGQHLRPHRLRRLLQVHTHGNDWTEHSKTDDEEAYSMHPGALSLVLPWHAAGRPVPTDGTLHLRRWGKWTALDRDETGTLLRLVPSVLDHSGHDTRSTTCPTSEAATPELQTGWSQRLTQRMKSLLWS